MLDNQINLSKHIFFKLCSSLKMKAQLITRAEQPVSGHNILQGFKPIIIHHCIIIFTHTGGRIYSRFAGKSLATYCPGFYLEICQYSHLS